MSHPGPFYRMRMACCWKHLLAIVLGIATSGYQASVLAEENVGYSDLLHRLQAQEERILQLESQQQSYQRLPATNVTYSHSSPESESTLRLEKVESELADLKKSNLVTSGTSGSTMKISGRVHADYWGFPESSPGANAFENGNVDDSVQDRIGFRRIRIQAAGKLKDNMEYKVELELAGANESEIRDVYLGFNDLPVAHTLLIGNQKRPYGLDHLNSSRYNVFIERPFVIEAINQDARRLGICSYGLSDDQQYNWRFGVYNGRLIQDEGNYISDHLQAEVAGRFANTWWYDEASDGRGYGHWAISGTVSHPDGSSPTDGDPRAINEARFQTRPEARTRRRWLDTGVIDGADWYEMLGAEGVLNFGPVQWVGEYQNLWLQRDPGAGEDLHFDGGYMYVSYFLTGEHMPWERKSGTLGRVKPFENFWLVDTCNDGVRGGMGAWQIALRWSYANFTDQDIAGGIGESVTAGLNWYWNPNANLQFNYIYGDIHAHSPVDGQTSGNYHIIGTRFRIDY